MLNYRRLCRYSETEKRLVISALEAKHFSNGTSEEGLLIFRFKRERHRWMSLASLLGWGSGSQGVSLGAHWRQRVAFWVEAFLPVFCNCPSSDLRMPSLFLSSISQMRKHHSKILRQKIKERIGIWTQTSDLKISTPFTMPLCLLPLLHTLSLLRIS